MTVYKMNLSTTEPNNAIGIVKIRQYDSETQIFEATITADGKPVSLEGLTVLFCVRASPVTGLGLSEQLVSEVDAKNGIVRHTLTDYDMQQVGLNKGYFAFRTREDDSERFKHQFSTKDFPYTVMPSIFSDGIKDSNYIWTFEEILRYFQEWVQESMKTYDDWYLVAQEELQRIIAEFNSWIGDQKADYQDWLQANKSDFSDWLESLRDILDENAAGNLQNQFDKINPTTEVVEIVHNTKKYPGVRVLYWEYGIATVPLEYEVTGLGGNNVITINSAVEYLDRSSMKIKVPRYYKLVNSEKIVLENAVRLISDHRILQIEFDDNVELKAPIKPISSLSISEITKNSAVLSWSGDSGDVVITKEVTLIADLKGKIAGSVVENPNSAYAPSAATLITPSTISESIEFSDSRYTQMSELDNSLVTISRSNANQIAQAFNAWDVANIIKNYQSDYFSKEGAVSKENEVALARAKVSALKTSSWIYGSGAGATRAQFQLYNKVTKTWVGSQSNTTTAIKQLSYNQTQTTNINYINDDCKVYTLMHAPSSDETTASTLNLDYATIEITFPAYETLKNRASGFVLTDLDSNTTYTVKVVNEAGESEVITFTTL